MTASLDKCALVFSAENRAVRVAASVNSGEAQIESTPALL